MFGSLDSYCDWMAAVADGSNHLQLPIARCYHQVMILLNGIRKHGAKGDTPSGTHNLLDAISIRKQFLLAYQDNGRGYLSFQSKPLNLTSIILIDARWELLFPHGIPPPRMSPDAAVLVPSLPVDWWKSGERVVHEPHTKCKDMFKAESKAANLLVSAVFQANLSTHGNDCRHTANPFLNIELEGTPGFSIGELGRVQTRGRNLWRTWKRTCQKSEVKFLLHPSPEQCQSIDLQLSDPYQFHVGLSTGITPNCVRAWRILRNNYVARSFVYEAERNEAQRNEERNFSMPGLEFQDRIQLFKVVIETLHSIADQAGSTDVQNEVFGSAGTAQRIQAEAQHLRLTRASSSSAPPRMKSPRARNLTETNAGKEPKKSPPNKKRQREEIISNANGTPSTTKTRRTTGFSAIQRRRTSTRPP
jgi:hypothetical protein